MYKSELHNLCQQKGWHRPSYSVSRTGPDHDPRFQATVTVNGLKFDGIGLSKSSKEAQRKSSQAALHHFASSQLGSSAHEVSQVAFNHFASGPAGSSPPTIATAESELSCTSQLLAYARKYLSHVPEYTFECQGLGSALRCKAKVTVGERTFCSRVFFKTLKEAENDAAKAALLHLPSEETNSPQDDSVSYMDLLNELAQKAGMKMPVYKTGSDGASYMPVFSSVVDVGNNIGKVAKSKIQAEMNAAKVAWLKLNEVNDANSGKASSHLPDSSEHVPLNSQSAVSKNVVQSQATKNHPGRILDNKGDNEISMQNDSGFYASSLKCEMDTTEQNKFTGVDISPSAFLPFQDNADDVPRISSVCNTRPVNSQLLYNRVRVYPRKDDMVLPEGATCLPFSDANWVAFSLDSNFEDVEMAEVEEGQSKSSLKPTGGIGKKKKKKQHLNRGRRCRKHRRKH